MLGIRITRRLIANIVAGAVIIGGMIYGIYTRDTRLIYTLIGFATGWLYGYGMGKPAGAGSKT